MPRYVTKAELSRIRNGLLTEDRQRLVKAAQDRSPSGSTFLSYSSHDHELLPAVVKVLQDHGALVYVDRLDSSLPAITSRETAALLRSRIQLCRRLVMFATEASKDSRWVPWELGLSDAFKGASGTAVLPSVEATYETSWTEREYLGLYDRIVFGVFQGEQEERWMVWNQDRGTAMPLRTWLAG